MKRSWVLGFAAAALACGTARACFDVAKGEPQALDGVVEARLFPGSMADVATGQATEPGFILKLDAPICLTGSDETFLEVDVRPAGATAAALRKVEGMRTQLELSHPYAAMTVHDHRPLVASVERVTAVAAPASLGGSVVRAFYEALSAGNGAAAAALVAPQRRHGALGAEAMTRFYGGLRQRLKLEFVWPQGDERYLVRYTFAQARQGCVGRALVMTETRGGGTWIESLKALDGC